MNSRKDPAFEWQTVFDQIDAMMYVTPEDALKLCKQVFVESYLWEPPIYVRAAERYGKIMDHLGRSSEARSSLLAAQQASQGSCLPIYEAKILERLARGYYTDGDYQRAAQYWHSCIAVIDQTGGDAETRVLAKVGLAQVCKGAGDYAAALDMLNEAQAHTEEIDDPHLDVKVKINLAVCLIELARSNEALAILLETFKTCSEHQLLDYLAESNLYLGKIALANGEPERSLAYLEAGLAASRQVKFRWCEAHILALKAKVYFSNGDFEMALQNVKQAQGIAIDDGFSDMLVQQHYAAAEYAAALNDFATAFVEYKAGHVCEQRLSGKAPLAQSLVLEKQPGSHQNLNRMLLELTEHREVN